MHKTGGIVKKKHIALSCLPHIAHDNPWWSCKYSRQCYFFSILIVFVYILIARKGMCLDGESLWSSMMGWLEASSGVQCWIDRKSPSYSYSASLNSPGFWSFILC